VLSPVEVVAVLRSIDEFATSLKRLPSTHFYFRWAFELAAHPNLLDTVESILGPDILVWGTLILSKPAASRAIVSWHQDSAYTAFLNGSPALSAWLALTPATPRSGCMRVIPASHGSRLPFSTVQHPDDMTIRGIEVIADIDPESAVDLELQPGEASLHDISLIHGSNANQSAVPRTGFIIRYATPAMRQPQYPVYCVRGNPGNIVCAQAPDDEGASRLAAYAEYLAAEAISSADPK